MMGVSAGLAKATRRIFELSGCSTAPPAAAAFHSPGSRRCDMEYCKPGSADRAHPQARNADTFSPATAARNIATTEKVSNNGSLSPYIPLDHRPWSRGDPPREALVRFWQIAAPGQSNALLDAGLRPLSRTPTEAAPPLRGRHYARSAMFDRTWSEPSQRRRSPLCLVNTLSAASHNAAVASQFHVPEAGNPDPSDVGCDAATSAILQPIVA
jgi:hypothetical protein